MCNMDCFNCKYDDCINDEVTETEKLESNLRDILNNSHTLPAATLNKQKHLKGASRRYCSNDFHLFKDEAV